MNDVPDQTLQSLYRFVDVVFALLFCRAIEYLPSFPNLTRPGLTSAERFTRTDLSNPLTAVIAAALSWSGLTIWTLSWFILMPLFSMLLSRRRPAKSAAG